MDAQSSLLSQFKFCIENKEKLKQFKERVGKRMDRDMVGVGTPLKWIRDRLFKGQNPDRNAVLG